MSNQGFLTASGNQPAIFTEYPAGDTSRYHKHCTCMCFCWVQSSMHIVAKASLASQPTSAQREGSGELSIRLLSRRNVISYATFGLHLCDRGIVNRCSTAPWQSGHANSKTSTICSSRLPGPSWQQWVMTQLGPCHRIVVWHIEKYQYA